MQKLESPMQYPEFSWITKNALFWAFQNYTKHQSSLIQSIKGFEGYMNQDIFCGGSHGSILKMKIKKICDNKYWSKWIEEGHIHDMEKIRECRILKIEPVKLTRDQISRN